MIKFIKFSVALALVVIGTNANATEFEPGNVEDICFFEGLKFATNDATNSHDYANALMEQGQVDFALDLVKCFMENKPIDYMDINTIESGTYSIFDNAFRLLEIEPVEIPDGVIEAMYVMHKHIDDNSGEN